MRGEGLPERTPGLVLGFLLGRSMGGRMWISCIVSRQVPSVACYGCPSYSLVLGANVQALVSLPSISFPAAPFFLMGARLWPCSRQTTGTRWRFKAPAPTSSPTSSAISTRCHRSSSSLSSPSQRSGRFRKMGRGPRFFPLVAPELGTVCGCGTRAVVCGDHRGRGGQGRGVGHPFLAHRLGATGPPPAAVSDVPWPTLASVKRMGPVAGGGPLPPSRQPRGVDLGATHAQQHSPSAPGADRWDGRPPRGGGAPRHRWRLPRLPARPPAHPPLAASLLRRAARTAALPRGRHHPHWAQAGGPPAVAAPCVPLSRKGPAQTRGPSTVAQLQWLAPWWGWG